MDIYQQRLKLLLRVLQEFNPQRIYAYGSWANNSAQSDSDVDLAVVVEDSADILTLKRQFALRLWEEKYPFDLEPDVHIIPKRRFNYRLSKGDPFITNVVKGKIVYGS